MTHHTLFSSPAQIFNALHRLKTSSVPLALHEFAPGTGLRVRDDLLTLNLICGPFGDGRYNATVWATAEPVLLARMSLVVAVLSRAYLQENVRVLFREGFRSGLGNTDTLEALDYILKVLAGLGWVVTNQGANNHTALTELGQHQALQFLDGTPFSLAKPDDKRNDLLDILLLLPCTGTPAHVIHSCHVGGRRLVETIAELDKLVKGGAVVRGSSLSHYLTPEGRKCALLPYNRPAVPATPTPKPLEEADYGVLWVFLSFSELSNGQLHPLKYEHSSHDAAMQAPGGYNDNLSRVHSLTDGGYLNRDALRGIYSISQSGEKALKDRRVARSTPVPEKPVSEELEKTVRRLNGRVSRVEDAVEQIKKDVCTPSVIAEPRPVEPGTLTSLFPGLPTTRDYPSKRIVRFLTASLQNNPALSDHWITPEEVCERLYLTSEHVPSVVTITASATICPDLRVFTIPENPGKTFIALRNPRPAVIPAAPPTSDEDNRILARVNAALFKRCVAAFDETTQKEGSQRNDATVRCVALLLAVNKDIGRLRGTEGYLIDLVSKHPNTYRIIVSGTPASPLNTTVQFKEPTTVLRIKKWLTEEVIAYLLTHHEGKWACLADVAKAVGISVRTLSDVVAENLSPEYTFVGHAATDELGVRKPMLKVVPKGQVPVDHPKPSDSPNQEGKWVRVDQEKAEQKISESRKKGVVLKSVEKAILVHLKQSYRHALSKGAGLSEPWDNRQIRISAASLANRTGYHIDDVLDATAASRVLTWYASPTGYNAPASHRLDHDGFIGFIATPTLGDIRHWIADIAYVYLKASLRTNPAESLAAVATYAGVSATTLWVSVKGDDRFFEWTSVTGDQEAPMLQLSTSNPPVTNVTPAKAPRQASLMAKVVQWLKDNTTPAKPWHTTEQVRLGISASLLTPGSKDVLRCLEKSAREHKGVQVRVVDHSGNEGVRWTWGPALAALRRQSRGTRRQVAVALAKRPDHWFTVGDIAVASGRADDAIVEALNVRRYDFPVEQRTSGGREEFHWSLKQQDGQKGGSK